MKKVFLLFSLIFVLAFVASAQQTILQVPSTDTTGKGHAAVRFDLAYFPEAVNFTLAPNVMYGITDKLDVGLNVEAVSRGDQAPVSIVPNFKLKLYDKADGANDARTTFVIGNKFYLPVHNKTFSGGNYFYGAGSLLIETGTRFTAGIYNQQNVFAHGNRTGAILGLEQWLLYTKNGDRPLLTGAVDWQSGHNGIGYTTLGVIFNPTSRILIQPAYTLGNSTIGSKNHGAVLSLGYTF